MDSFALEVAPRITNFFESYFGVKYVLPKQDNVAVPDFTFGAMENWGLITYRWAELTSLVADFFCKKKTNGNKTFSSLPESRRCCTILRWTRSEANSPSVTSSLTNWLTSGSGISVSLSIDLRHHLFR